MLVDDANEANQGKLEEIVEKISAKSFTKYSLREELVITKGKSIFDVIQDKLKEFFERNKKPESNPANDSKWLDRNINQGVRKLHKNAENLGSIDDEQNFNARLLAEESKIQSRLEKYQIIQKVLENYTARNKLIIELRFFAELDDEETARRANTTEGNVRKVVYDFRHDCRLFIKPSGKGQNSGGKNDGKRHDKSEK